ncbi:hypothetical protein GCM10012285_28030 [Streptomyces kronopolitis]|uniref:Secreted protein n=1 Tax=Streptomyces kronopolitis TaxID=1612435 RepID=A0ABQ2JHA2_9ACTN|nr:hypothetical protein GCM10012285_28030 [Streptomyces kronopolitis]
MGFSESCQILPVSLRGGGLTVLLVQVGVGEQLAASEWACRQEEKVRRRGGGKRSYQGEVGIRKGLFRQKCHHGISRLSGLGYRRHLNDNAVNRTRCRFGGGRRKRG